VLDAFSQTGKNKPKDSIQQTASQAGLQILIKINPTPLESGRRNQELITSRLSGAERTHVQP
jgi:hypothetical protein